MNRLLKSLKNKDGSAILWTILFTIILTILLGTLLTLSYGYHKSTIATVKRQQAYFTARSATDSIIAELATNGSLSSIMPQRSGTKISIDNFDFPDSDQVKMGTAKAVIKKVAEDEVEVTVTATYTDSEYKMTATIKNQPLYFGGIAVRNLTIPVNSTFRLTENTDLYIDDTAGFTGRLDIGGNLICKGDIKLLTGSNVNGTSFSKDTIYDNNLATVNPKKQIWNSEKYIISNYTMDVKYPNFIQTQRMLIRTILKGDYNRELCNNVSGFSFNPTIMDNFDLSKYALTNSARYIKITNRNLRTDPNVEPTLLADNNVGLFNPKKIKQADGSYYTPLSNAAGVINDATDANAAYLLGLWDRYVTEDPSNYNNLAWPFGDGTGSNRYFLKDCYDVNQIKYSSSGYFDAKDDVTSIAYVLIDKNCTMRIRYGLNAEYGGILGDLQDFSNVIRDKKISYIYVYLDDGATLELGTSSGPTAAEIKRLNFYMSIFGTENSRVVLNNNVKIHGSINVGSLEIRDGANVTINYITSNGGQVAKQQVDELWTISNYSD